MYQILKVLKHFRESFFNTNNNTKNIKYIDFVGAKLFVFYEYPTDLILVRFETRAHYY